MANEYHFARKNRLSRIIQRLRLLRPTALPATYRGNRILLFTRGHSFFRSLHMALRRAERFILVEFYFIRDDRTGAALADELVRAVGRGVSVWLIYDYIGSLETPASFFEEMARQGVRLIPFNVPSFRRGFHWFDRRDHRKMVVIDGVLAFLGGFNVGDEYSGLMERPQRFRDVGFSIMGNTAGVLVRGFSEIWRMEQGELPALPPEQGDLDPRAGPIGGADIAIVSGGPHQRHSFIRGAFLLNIAAATREILIATPYFVPGPRLIRALRRAARRGVKVRLLLPARSDAPLVRLLGRSFYGALLRQGVDICELDREILHAKVMLIDRERTIMGSANLDQRSFHRNFEINCVIEDAVFGRQIGRMLLRDFRESRPITLDDHERRGVASRLLERLIKVFDRFL
jgi:cardiolipin synthase A/B